MYVIKTLLSVWNFAHINPVYQKALYKLMKGYSKNKEGAKSTLFKIKLSLLSRLDWKLNSGSDLRVCAMVNARPFYFHLGLIKIKQHAQFQKLVKREVSKTNHKRDLKYVLFQNLKQCVYS